jgi:hypothetical protein
MSDSNNNLGDLIESARKDVQAQQDKVDEQIHRAPTPPRGKQIFTALLLAVLTAVLLYQYPRFDEPYTWPDPATNPSAAEGSLIEVVGLIETYRISQGKYPEQLSQIAMPQGLAQRIADSPLLYRPAEQAYTLEWAQPHWRTRYDSLTEKVIVEPASKP